MTKISQGQMAFHGRDLVTIVSESVGTRNRVRVQSTTSGKAQRVAVSKLVDIETDGRIVEKHQSK